MDAVEVPNESLFVASSSLVFGMVFSAERRSNQGQPFRDRMRCQALEENTFCKVYTCDIDHDDVEYDDVRVTEGNKAKPTRLRCHVRANFNDPRRMFAAFRTKFGANFQVKKDFGITFSVQ